MSSRGAEQQVQGQGLDKEPLRDIAAIRSITKEIRDGRRSVLEGAPSVFQV